MTRYSKKYLFFPIRYFMQKQKLIRVKMNLESKNNMTLKLILPDAYQSVFPFNMCILVFNSIKSSNLQLKSSTDWCFGYWNSKTQRLNQYLASIQFIFFNKISSAARLFYKATLPWMSIWKTMTFTFTYLQGLFERKDCVCL